jgi:branched-chain amino acid aminotransferase
MEIPYSVDELLQACVDSVEVSGLPECYIRPLVFRGAGEMGVLPRNCPVHTAIAVWPWGAYLGAEGLTEGVDVMVSSWQRVAPNTIPAMAKIGGAYVLSQLAKMEAVRYGYVEAIMLDADGRISEGTGENVFVVLDGRIMTPPLSSSILGGITRNSVITLAKERGYDFVEQTLNREILYMAQEVFMTGTAAEVTPIRSVDRLPVGTGKPGPVTMALQEDFFDLVRGKVADRHRWLTPVAPAAVPAD